MPAEKSLTLNINGKKYSGWTKAKITRGIDRAVGDFEFEVSERWLNKSNGQLQIQPQDTCTIYAGSDLLLTGYVDKYKPSVDANNHKVVISGRSKTGDLVDSSVDFLGGQIQSGTLLAMATALCAPFHIKVRTSLGKNGSKVNSTPGDATVQPGETVFNFLERLARQVGVLLTDDPAGNLVLTQADGGGPSATNVILGKNLLSGNYDWDESKVYSDYYITSQKYGVAILQWLNTNGYAEETRMKRHRPLIVTAETSATDEHAQERAEWMKHHAWGMSKKCTVVLEGWRQGSGKLWTPNMGTTVDIPFFNLNTYLLIVKVTYKCDMEKGFTTEMLLGPVEGYTPDPGEVKTRGQDPVGNVTPESGKPL